MKTLVIVDPNRPDVFERLTTRFAHEPSVQVVFDRRRIVSRLEDERRDPASIGSWADGYLIVRRP